MPILSVTQLTQHIKNRLESDHLLINLWVKGEISNFKQPASGHLYFTLKDSSSCVKTVMFRSRAERVPFRPDNGMSVLIRGYVSVYERDGNYQLYAQEMEPDGIGALYLAFEQLKEKLLREGLFDSGKKKPLPRFPATIGIITSPTGAVVRDMIKIIGMRWPQARLVLVPVSVQGDNAPGDICRGIEQINRWGGADVIILGRGGGSLEELWAFNTEMVARAVAASNIPIISAVGHETDITITDFAADKRAATPSAAAEMVVPHRQDMDRQVQVLQLRSQRAIKQYIDRYRHLLERYGQSRALKAPERVMVDSRRQHVDMLQRDLVKTIRLITAGKGGKLGSLVSALDSLSPLATLARGYSVCTDQQGNIIKSYREVEVGSTVTIKLNQGILSCEVIKGENDQKG